MTASSATVCAPGPKASLAAVWASSWYSAAPAMPVCPPGDASCSALSRDSNWMILSGEAICRPTKRGSDI